MHVDLYVCKCSYYDIHAIINLPVFSVNIHYFYSPSCIGAVSLSLQLCVFVSMDAAVTHGRMNWVTQNEMNNKYLPSEKTMSERIFIQGAGGIAV